MSSGFVSEKDLAEYRERRQAEWEKVRKEDQPLECPEEPYDGRSLFERLREQKMKKDMEYEEAHKLKNLIRGLDSDEVQFLELVDQNKIDAEKKQLLEEAQEMKEFRNRVVALQEESVDKKIQSELQQPKTKSNMNSRPSQKALLGVSVKRKHEDPVQRKVADSVSKSTTEVPQKQTPQRRLSNVTTDQFDRGAFKCIAVLPGIGPYNESSDSELSSGSEEDPEEYGKYDLVGRKIKKKKICGEE